jgi:cysteine-rich repeat protein
MQTPRSNLRSYVSGAVVAALIAATGSCFFASRTTLCEASGLRCSPGQECAVAQAACIAIGGCGDLRVDATKGEICDDGNIVDGDGCSADCTSDESCGNRVIDGAADELCDDGNTAAGDGCSATCALERCGNKVLDPDEACDDGNATPGDGCSADCTSNEACGNATVDATVGEQCDPENRAPLPARDTDVCNSDCTTPRCGDAHVNPRFVVPDTTGGHTEQCDDGVETSGCNVDCTFARCGDGYTNLAADEKCDTARIDTPTCNGLLCTAARCGDSYTNKMSGEVCDQAGDTATCNGGIDPRGKAFCKPPSCGDGYKNPAFMPSGGNRTEECDNGRENSDATPNACRKNCTNAGCGDGVLDAGEQCEQGSSCTSPRRCVGCMCVL